MSRRDACKFTIWVLLGLLTCSDPLFAQNNNGGNGNQNQGQNQNNVGGILIDAEGVLLSVAPPELSQTLQQQRQRSMAASRLPSRVLARSECRKVSLARLEKALEGHVDRQDVLPTEMAALAGLTRLDYVFVDPEQKDVILAGPAEGFAPDGSGRPRGIESGRPTLRLDDLLVALRIKAGSARVGCSIDPQPEKLAELNRYLASQSTPATIDVVESRFREMGKLLGLYDVRVLAVPENTLFARRLVEADYRMKRIAMGLESPGIKGLPSHLSMLGSQGNSMQRWWFVPLYDSVHKSEDQLAYAWSGPRVQLMSQEELIDLQGRRHAAATTRVSTQNFARKFTERFPELAEQSPVFADLQGLIDWCLFERLFRQERMAERSGWTPQLLLDEARLPVTQVAAVRRIPALVNARRASRGMVVGLVGGGVEIDVSRWTSAESLVVDPAGRLDSTRTLQLSREKSSQTETPVWWWD